MGTLFDILIGVMSSLIAAYIYQNMGKINEFIIRVAARISPTEIKERLEEEWLAHLHETRSKFRAIQHTLGVALASILLRYEEEVGNPDFALYVQRIDTRGILVDCGIFSKRNSLMASFSNTCFEEDLRHVAIRTSRLKTASIKFWQIEVATKKTKFAIVLTRKR